MREALQFGVRYHAPYENREEYDRLTEPFRDGDTERELMNDRLENEGLADMEIVSAPLGWQN